MSPISPGAAQTLPPEPSKASEIGDTVFNPITEMNTTVSGLMRDPDGTPTAGDTAFAQTADGYAFLVKGVDELIYNRDVPPLAFKIVKLDEEAGIATLDALTGDDDDKRATLRTGLLDLKLQAEFAGADTPGELTEPELEIGIDGRREVRYGRNGSDGRDGATFVPANAGGPGKDGPLVELNNDVTISATDRIGIEAGSRGGRGGGGGDVYLSFWDGADGGDGGRGGVVNVNNFARVTTSGDEAHGIFAYSRSGPAGAGGTGYLAPGGGTGGHSSDGGRVTVRNHGSVITAGVEAFGIYALSVSNNGGDSGSQWGLVGRAGSAGVGGSGGRIDIANQTDGDIRTSGAYAHGVLAQSVGGSGGNAGTSRNLLVSLQGAPDNGGDGGGVIVTNRGSLTTTGADARGIIAQSIGGGGGSSGSAGGLIALGGSGSGGGNGGTARADNGANGIIATTGIRADGLFVQSVGGSGGSGADAGGLIAIGGSGDNAGHGGVVTLINLGTISTAGAMARGIFAQSIGGGGGDGGSAGGRFVNLGGSGSGGGNGGSVNITQGGLIATRGDDARGVFAQSVGGGGGNGGSTVQVAAGSPPVDVNIGIGGDGGAGGKGGAVDITLQGMNDSAASVVRTEGDRAAGVFAQSVGGGGGNGGGTAQITAGSAVLSVSVGIGGEGGAGNGGGAVTLAHAHGAGIVETAGTDSAGVFLQSVGGGGGNGGYALSLAATAALGTLTQTIGGGGGQGGNGGTVQAGFDTEDELVDTTVLTTGARSPGLHAQSVGGGGGNGALAVSAASSIGLTASLGRGGKGSGGGSGGPVSVASAGDVTTEAAFSPGMLVHSVGGGGGNGGGSIVGSLAVGEVAGAVSVSLGGAGGSGGGGGEVDLVTRDATVSTFGERSAGIIAQSVGGGGGNGGYSVAVSLAGSRTGSVAYAVSLGGGGGEGGAGGPVNVDLRSVVSTVGDDARGVHAQSIGGGGGNGGFSVTTTGVGGAQMGAVTFGVAVGGNGGKGGSAGSVDAINRGTITTMGAGAIGLHAQSIGGGGGAGGAAYSGILTALGGEELTAILTLGGDGGDGGYGGTVDVTNEGAIATQGDRADGVNASSVGGGGGDAALVLAARLDLPGPSSRGGGSDRAIGLPSFEMTLGGGAGSGGGGDTVTVTNEGVITTTGDSARGVSASSVGGGGGDAALVLDAQLDLSDLGARSDDDDESTIEAPSLEMKLGGQGGDGSAGGAVTVINRSGSAAEGGRISTAGADSYGVHAQSLGGGGGNGSMVVGIELSADSPTGPGDSLVSDVIGELISLPSLVVGGSGGSGSDGGTVTVNNEGSIETEGDRAHGIFAQSIGGGGGNAGAVLEFSSSIELVETDDDEDDEDPLTVAIGGKGGAGGTVTVRNDGSIGTRGVAAHGIYAQSVGGGGGDAGIGLGPLIDNAGIVTAFAALAASVGALDVEGGAPGDSGAPGSIIVDQTGDIRVRGDGAEALLVDAVEGAGGTLHYDFEAIMSLPGLSEIVDPTSATRGSTAATPIVAFEDGIATVDQIEASSDGSMVSIALGSTGISDRSGGQVMTETSGTFVTEGRGSAALGITSTGGGGGTVNAVFDFNAADVFDDFFGLALELGGQDGARNIGGTIDGSHTGELSTFGASSPGVLAQSLSSGGRSAVTVDGRRASFGAARIVLGSTDSDAQRGGPVSRRQLGDIATDGPVSPGMVLQSVGGGGGSVSVADVEDVGVAHADVEVSLGARGGAGHTGAAVEAALSGSVTTRGDHSPGLVLQSIGGGGGEVRLSGVQSAAVTLGGHAGAAGDGGAVTFTQSGDILTFGRQSTGVLAQSVGGGGGLVLADTAEATASTFALASDNSGNGGVVVLDQRGDVRALGAGSVGLLAQSVGGGGGVGGDRFVGTAGGDGTGDTVSIQSVGNIVAGGAGGIAVLAQSRGTAGDDIDVSVDGVIKGGSGEAAAAIALDGGQENQITVGERAFMFAINERVLDATDGDDAVSSSGVVLGNIGLGAGSNRFTNETAGTLLTLDTVDLGRDGMLFNAGQWIPGGSIVDPITPLADAFDADHFVLRENRAQITRIDGSAELTDSSELLLDVSFRVEPEVGGDDSDSDLITLTGGATIDGLIVPTLLRLERVRPLVVIDPTTPPVDNGAEVTDTVVVDYSIGLDGQAGDGTSVDLIADPDFSIDGMNGNQRALGDYINTILDGEGSAALGELFAFIGNQSDPDVVVDSIDRLTTEGYAGVLIDTMVAANSFADSMSRCEVPYDLSRTTDTHGDHCVWVQSKWRGYRRDEHVEFKPLESTSYQLASGRRSPAGANWRIGFAGGIEEAEIDVGERFESIADRVFLGASLQHRRGELLLDAISNLSVGYHDSTRVVGIDGRIAEGRSVSIGTLTNDHRVNQGHLRLRASLDRVGSDPRVRVRPSLDLDLNYIHFGGAREHGDDVHGARLESGGTLLATATSAIDIAGRFVTGPRTEVHPYVRGGIAISSIDDMTVDARLGGAPRSDGTFSNDAGFDQEHARLSVGFTAKDLSNDISFRFGYDGAFGLRSTQYETRASLLVEF